MQIGAGGKIGEVHALAGSCGVNGAAFAQGTVFKENTGAVFSGFEGVFSLHVFFADFTICNTEIPCHSIYIQSVNVKCGAFKFVTAVSRAVVAVNFMVQDRGGNKNSCHNTPFDLTVIVCRKE